MNADHRPLLPGEMFRIRNTGNEHTAGEIDCPGCGMIDGIRYPHPHRDKTIIHLDFLVHGEAFQDAFDRCCEGGCFVPPIKFAPKLPRKIIENNPPGGHYASMDWQHITDHDLERYYLGMVKNETELAALEEHILACASCAVRAAEAQDYVDAMRAAALHFAHP